LLTFRASFRAPDPKKPDPAGPISFATICKNRSVDLLHFVQNSDLVPVLCGIRSSASAAQVGSKPKVICQNFLSFLSILCCLRGGEGSMLSQRQRKILSQIEAQQRVRVDDLAMQFATTPQTIRKDLQALAELHHIVRFHGGAALVGGVEYTTPAERRTDAQEAKAAIGAAVAGRIPQTCAVFLNAGTTTAQVARMLSGHQQLRVISDNVDLAAEMRGFSGVEVIVPGGAVRRSDGAILGAEAVDYIRQFRVDYAIIGAAALAEDGTLLDYDLAEVQVCRAMMTHAAHVILAIDAGKFGRRAPVKLGHLSDIHTLVTDTANPAWVAPLSARHEVELILASG
jgi:DeoR family glycerol-3-phosphate regulon repressor